MRAIGIEAFGGRDRLRLLDLPIPVPGAGEVRIRVRAAGVNPVDWKIREGLLKDRLPHRFPVVLGWDAAGVVDAVGPDVRRLSPGDAVWAYARKPAVQGGTYAEYVVVPEACAAVKPRSLDFARAAAVPLAALTAWQGLLGTAALLRGETVVVTAAAGGVGMFAVQVARDLGARVIAVASRRNHAFLRSLGAAETIDYRDGDTAELVRRGNPEGVDVWFDGVGGDSLRSSPDALRDGGRVVSIVETPTGPRFSERGVRADWMFVAPHPEQLASLARMADGGRLTVHVDDVFALEDAAAAHERIEGRHVRGKLVLLVEP